jgi:hypothetical protein
MLATWTKVLPVFVVQWLAQSRCPICRVDGHNYLEVYDDMLIVMKDKKARNRKWKLPRIHITW